MRPDRVMQSRVAGVVGTRGGVAGEFGASGQFGEAVGLDIEFLDL